MAELNNPAPVGRANDTWQDRLGREYLALRLRTRALQNFIATVEFFKLPTEDQNDLEEQLKYMKGYLVVVRRRARRAGIKGA